MKGILCTVMSLKNNIQRIAAVFLAAVLLLTGKASAAPSAKYGIMMDSLTGRVLWEKEPDHPALIASTTKIMTGYLTAKYCDLDSRVAVPPEAVGTEGSSIYLKQGEVLTVRELLYGLMLHSGNDAAVTLAMYISGNTEAFAELMNREAEELGMKNTSFSNPHGLDDEGNYSTARDLAVLTVQAMKHPVFRQVVSTKTASVGSRTFTNHNKLLWRYEGAVGVKTGFTKAAGRILVSCAERQGRQLVAVTISAPDDWNDHMSLMDYGFDAFSCKKMAAAGECMGQVPVLSGAEDTVDAVLTEDVSCTAREDETIEMITELPPFVFAPVLAGDPAGRIIILIDGTETASYPLYWKYSVLGGT